MTSRYKPGEWAEAMVSEKLKELPPEYTVIRNVDIADRGRNSELDTVVVTPTGVIVVLEVKAGSLQSDAQGHLVRDYAEGKQKDITRQLGRQGSIARTRLSELSRRLTIRSFLVLPNGHLEGSGIGIDRTKVIEADRFDELFKLHGTDKDHLLMVTIYIADMALKAEMNEVYNAWTTPGRAPARVCIESKIDGGYLLEMSVIAAIC